jgi:hypothetical protein
MSVKGSLHELDEVGGMRIEEFTTEKCGEGTREGMSSARVPQRDSVD